MTNPAGRPVPNGPVAAPGWYPDPWAMAPLRFHDGYQWTPVTAPLPSGPPAPSDATTRALVPVGRTPLSIVAGYVALLSVLVAPAPVALVLGICALQQLRQRPGMYGRGRAIFAIVMGGFFTVVLAILIFSANR